MCHKSFTDASNLNQIHSSNLGHVLYMYSNNLEVNYFPHSDLRGGGMHFYKKYHAAAKEIGIYFWVLGMLGTCIEQGQLWQQRRNWVGIN
jgi:hypothetical protein